jgi:hypothetical protein
MSRPSIAGTPASHHTPAIDWLRLPCGGLLVEHIAIALLSMALALPLLVDSGTLVPQADVLHQSVVLQLLLYLFSYRVWRSI